jgi:Spy/CpxP family protein refolding chaperone
MKHLKKTIISTVAIASIAVGATAFAQRGDGDRHHGDRMLERIESRLELTDTQSAALATLADELTQTRELMRGNGSELRDEISSLINADTFDQGKALTMINERAAALQAKAPELVAAAAGFFDGLSAEQKAQIQQFAAKRAHRHGDQDDDRN